jgi:hypothetical protein
MDRKQQLTHTCSPNLALLHRFNFFTSIKCFIVALLQLLQLFAIINVISLHRFTNLSLLPERLKENIRQVLDEAIIYFGIKKNSNSITVSRSVAIFTYTYT